MKGAHKLDVLFEDKWIVIVDKPTGMLSVGYPGYPGKSAQDILTDLHRSRGKIRVQAVHRLDRDTSGVMMFALSAEARERIMDSWQEMVSERTYRAVCSRAPGAKPLPDAGVIDAPIAYNRQDVGYVPKTGDAALKDAEKAVTRFRVVARGARYDLVECELETGRKNQIRVHLAHLGHPIAGDEAYGIPGPDGATDDPIGRLCLHARVLAFTHPYTGTPHRFESPEPASFARAVGVTRSTDTRATAPRAADSRTDKAGKKNAEGTTATDKPAKPRAAAPAGVTGVTGEKVPRRQRGRDGMRRPTPESRAGEYFERDAEARPGDDERSAAKSAPLTPLRRKSRTRQGGEGSRFIPSAPKKGPKK